MSENKEIYWVHYIRAMAVLFVVLLHVAAQILQLDVAFASPTWWVGNIVDSAMRFCVPLLFMLSGFLLVGKQEPLGTFFTKRMSKIAIPLLIWSIVYVVWILLVEANNPTPISPFTEEIGQAVTQLFPFSLIGLLFAPAYYHLWFMYALIGLYLCIPLVRVLVQNADRQLLKYFVVLWAVSTYFFPALMQAKMYIGIDIGLVTGNVGFLILGYLLGTTEVSKRKVLLMCPLFLLGVTMTAWGTWWISTPEELNQLFYGNMPNSLLMSIPGFLILRYVGQNSRLLNQDLVKRVVLKCSQCAFGIYLVHPLFLYCYHKGLFGFTLDAVQGEALLFVPLTTIMVYLSSIVVVAGLRKVPYLRAAVP